MDEDVAFSCGVKRKHEDDTIEDCAASVDQLRECLFNTCISKLTSKSKTTATSRRATTLRHSVLIQNMLRSLHTNRTPGPRPAAAADSIVAGRARITARRLSAETRTEQSMAVSEENQEQEQPTSSLWQQDQQISSWGPTDSEVTSPHSVPDIASPPFRAGTPASLPTLTDPEPLDASSDFVPLDPDINFFEPEVPQLRKALFASETPKLKTPVPIVCVMDDGNVVEITDFSAALVYVRHKPCSRVIVVT